MEKMTKCLRDNKAYFDEKLQVNKSFDIINRTMKIGGKDSVIYFIDGFCKDDLMQKMLQFFVGLKNEEMSTTAADMIHDIVPHVEVETSDDWQYITHNVLSGVLLLLIDGYDEGILIDSRTYPARSVSEPDKDKVLRGSKDGFVETVIFNINISNNSIIEIFNNISMHS